MPTETNHFSLGKKLEIIAQRDGGATYGDIAHKRKCSTSTVFNIYKNKKLYLAEAEAGRKLTSKSCKGSQHPDVDRFVLNWHIGVREQQYTVSGDMLRQKAIEYARIAGYNDFKASTGWLQNFQHRHGMKSKVINGAGESVDALVMEEWNEQLPAIMSEYSPDNIFNADECGLFVHALPTKTLALPGDPCIGGKSSKKRITVLLCCNATGTDKLLPLVIGKAKKPRAFSAFTDLNKLPVRWRHNSAAWMTMQLFEDWLLYLNFQMRLKGKSILLFIDNAPCHVDLQLDNVRVVFFRPNTTAAAQPLDAGIIKCFKNYYRTQLLREIITLMDEQKSASDVVNAIREDKIVRFIKHAWGEVNLETIRNCFAKCGIKASGVGSVDEIDDHEQINQLHALVREVEPDCDVDAYLNVDADLPIEAEISAAERESDLMAACMRNGAANDDNDDTDDDIAVEVDVEEAKPSVLALKDLLLTLDKASATIQVEHAEVFDQFEEVRRCVVDKIVSGKIKAKRTG